MKLRNKEKLITILTYELFFLLLSILKLKFSTKREIFLLVIDNIIIKT